MTTCYRDNQQRAHYHSHSVHSYYIITWPHECTYMWVIQLLITNYVCSRVNVLCTILSLKIGLNAPYIEYRILNWYCWHIPGWVLGGMGRVSSIKGATAYSEELMLHLRTWVHFSICRWSALFYYQMYRNMCTVQHYIIIHDVVSGLQEVN